MVGKCIGNYIIERTLAQGGMGAVFVARDRALGRLAAIKFLSQDPECTLDIARRLLAEARITANLQHPNIVTAPEVPSGIAELIESCLAKDPRERPQSATEVATRFAAAGCVPSASPLRESAMHVRSSDLTAVSQSNLPLPVVHDTRGDVRHDVESDCLEGAWSLPGVERIRDDMAPDVETPNPPGPLARTMRLDKTDRVALNRLWLKLRQRADFPVFVQDSRELGRRSDFEEVDSAGRLGESILKDGALTAKLLRIVNSAYASRFGGAVESVQHAIVILGIDRVRSIALSVSLFENQGSDAQSLRVSESAISALISGEIAQQFACLCAGE